MVKDPTKITLSHPSMVFPTQARIDYRRLVEVEHNVRCKDVELVDVDSMHALLSSLEPVRAEAEL